MIQRHDGVRMDGSGHVHATKSGLAILVSVLIFKSFFFAHKGQVEYILGIFIPLYIRNNQ